MHASSLVQTLAELVRINSVNSGYDDGPGEAEMAAWVRRFFEQRGVEVWEQEVFPGRPNIIARLPGRDLSRRVVLEAHMDTVSIKGMSIPPFEPRIDSGRLFGRGSCDIKAGLAAMMHAVASLKQEGIVPPCEILLAAVVDEELSFRGVLKFCEGLTAAAAIVAEPTELCAVIAAKGVLRWRIRVHGRAAHSSKPHLGVNAITHMARVIVALVDEARSTTPAPHPLLGPATCNIGVIQGGVQVNFVPDECLIELDRRLLPGERTDDVLARYQTILDGLKARVPDLNAEMEPPMLCDEAVEMPPDAPVVRTAAAILEGMGLSSEPCGVPFSCDASKLVRAGVPSIIFGPGSIDRAHTAEEYVELDQVHQAYEFYRKFISTFTA